MKVLSWLIKPLPGKFTFFVVLLISSMACNREQDYPVSPGWPPLTRESKPWTRWWWPGNTLDKEDLSLLLKTYSEAGMGGVEITPTYGAMGYEKSYLDFLSPEWVEMFLHTLAEAEKLDLGVDMATGTGWNHGGPTVRDEHAPQRIIYKKYHLEEGKRLEEPVRCKQEPYVSFVRNQAFAIREPDPANSESETSLNAMPEFIEAIPVPDISEIIQPIAQNTNLQQLAINQVIFEKDLEPESLMAYSETGEILDLTEFVDNTGKLQWTASSGDWTIYALFRGWTGKMVERAGPGGEGFMVNPLSREALDDYLSVFDEAFRGKDISWLRSWFNDSYEVDDARFWCNWMPGFLEEFEARRGYKLQEHLPALFGEGEDEENARVLTDYRQTVMDLIIENYTRPWAEWARRQNKITRLQAHGSPGNLLDLYAASDIPETEGKDILRMKFASSAAHVTGKKIVSAEAATHLNESFTSTLSDLKRNVDKLFLAGVNHIFYHGTAYTPSHEDWPGWFFYVAVHLNPQNPIWEDLPACNAYAARVQSILQTGKPDPDFLLYFPVNDRYALRNTYRAGRVDGDGPHGKLLEHFNARGEGWETSVFRSLADTLQQTGYAIDFISDMQLQKVYCKKKNLVAGGNHYGAIIIPGCRYIPVETFSNILDLAGNGAIVIFQDQLPEDVPGLHRLQERQAALRELRSTLKFEPILDGLKQARKGKGMIYLGEDISRILALEKIIPEPMRGMGITYMRRIDEHGSFYFLRNESDKTIKGWVPFLAEAKSFLHFNPMDGNIRSLAFRKADKTGSEVYLQLDPWETCIIKTYGTKVQAESYNYLEPAGEGSELKGEWKLSFLKGGPTLPEDAILRRPLSWTDLPGDDVKKFSGTASYTCEFNKPQQGPYETFQGWWLDLGEVAESARIILNSREIGVLIEEPYRIFIPGENFLDVNRLEIRVTNLAANRIAELDRQGVFWKKFYNNNLRAAEKENVGPDGMFSAAHWEFRESGLVGPVNLVPVKKLKKENLIPATK